VAGSRRRLQLPPHTWTWRVRPVAGLRAAATPPWPTWLCLW